MSPGIENANDAFGCVVLGSVGQIPSLVAACSADASVALYSVQFIPFLSQSATKAVLFSFYLYYKKNLGAISFTEVLCAL